MKQTRLAHEARPAYDRALQLLVVVHRLADTDDRVTNERLTFHARSLLEHTASLGATRTRASLAVRTDYARLALAKLSATIDAARSMQLISEHGRAEVRELLIALEGLFDEPDRSSGRSGLSSGSDGNGAEAEPGELPPDTSLSTDDLSDLRQLIERDSRPAATSDASTYAVEATDPGG